MVLVRSPSAKKVILLLEQKPESGDGDQEAWIPNTSFYGIYFIFEMSDLHPVMRCFMSRYYSNRNM